MNEAQDVLTKVLEQQARLSEQIKAAFKRLDEQKSLTESVQELAFSVKLLAQSQHNTEKKVDSLTTDIETLKNKPLDCLDDQKKLVASINKQELSMKIIEKSQQNTEKKVDALTADVETLKSKPMKRLDGAIGTVITVIVTAAVTWLLTLVKR